MCVRGEFQQWLHLRLLWWNRGRPPANSVSYQRGGLQCGLPVWLQYEKGKLWRVSVMLLWNQIQHVLFKIALFSQPVSDLVFKRLLVTAVVVLGLSENSRLSSAARWCASRGEAAEAGGVYQCIQRGSCEGQQRSHRQHTACPCGGSEYCTHDWHVLQRRCLEYGNYSPSS